MVWEILTKSVKITDPESPSILECKMRVITMEKCSKNVIVSTTQQSYEATMFNTHQTKRLLDEMVLCIKFSMIIQTYLGH